MKNVILEKGPPTKTNLIPFKVKQGLAAIELGKTDRSIFSYLQFFSNIVPFENKTFVHVIPDMSLLTSFYSKTEGAPFSKYQLKDQIADELLKEVNTYFSKTKDTNRIAILEGNPLEEILEISDEINADLLLIGQDSNKSYHKILAKNLIRKSKGNALIIPSSAPTAITRILVPIDFSLYSKKALEMAIRINRQLENPVTIIALHIYEMPNLSHYNVGHSLVSFQASIKSDKTEALEIFLETVAPEDREFIKTQLILKDLPGTAHYIEETAEKDKADFVVMGVKGHSKIENLLLGSVAEKFITINKTIPTMIVG